MSHPTLDHQEFMDSLTITRILREHGPMCYHDLVVKACAHGVDVSGSGFDRALLCTLNTCLVKAQFAVCTAEEAGAYHKHSVRPGFDKPASRQEPKKTIYPPPKDLAFKLIRQRSEWIKLGKGEEED